MNQKNIAFARNLVKGKIAETIFAQMFRQGDFKVIDFGYDRVVPELVGNNYVDENSLIIEKLKTAPDFAVVDSSKIVRLVEVKYKKVFDHLHVLDNATRMGASWRSAWLFLATQDGFYFDDVDTICKNKGEMGQLNYSIIHADLQEAYLKILKDFEANN